MESIMEKVDSSNLLCYTVGKTGTGGDVMNATQIVRSLIRDNNVYQSSVAKKLGWTGQALSNKLRRNMLSADEFFKVIEALGCEIKIIKTETQDEFVAKQRKKGVGLRLRQMVDGVRYDTANADAICHWDDGEIMHELYQNDDGSYFVAQYVHWECGINSILPISETDAERLKAKYE